jgi:DNA-binding MarR family transcriptional regulator
MCFMASRKRVQNTHIGKQIRNLHGSLLDIVSLINRPQLDEVLIQEAAIPLERALFPLLVVIDKFGPIGVVDLADRVGRDYTTVSRQIAKLEGLDLVERKADAKDRRIRETAISAKGKLMTRAVDAARERLGRRVFETWDPRDFDELVRLMRKFADAIKDKS